MTTPEPAPTQLPEGRCECGHLDRGHIDDGTYAYCQACDDQSRHTFEPEGAAEGQGDGLAALRAKVLRLFERAPIAPYGPDVATQKVMEAIEAHYRPIIEASRAAVLKQFNDESWEGVADTKWAVGMSRDLKLDIIRWASRVVHEPEGAAEGQGDEALRDEIVQRLGAYGPVVKGMIDTMDALIVRERTQAVEWAELQIAGLEGTIAQLVAAGGDAEVEPELDEYGVSR